MKRKYLFAIAVASYVAFSCEKEKTEITVNDTDEIFMKSAASGNYNESDAGTLAASKATDGSVKAFGAMMASEHIEAQNELKALADKKRVSIPDGPDATHAAMKQQMSQMNGRMFDSTYMRSQVMDHQITINLFNNEIANGKDQEVRDYAIKYLPHIQMHFNRADSTSRRINGNGLIK